MRKLDLILENIRDEYMINLLEEGETTELETLKTKKFLNENLSRIRKMLIEEGALEGVKQHLGDNWGKYLAATGGAGLGAMAGMNPEGAVDMAGQAGDAAMAAPEAAADYADQAGGAMDAAGQAIGGAADAAGQFITDAAGNISDAAGNVVGNVQDLMAQIQG